MIECMDDYGLNPHRQYYSHILELFVGERGMYNQELMNKIHKIPPPDKPQCCTMNNAAKHISRLHSTIYDHNVTIGL